MERVRDKVSAMGREQWTHGCHGDHARGYMLATERVVGVIDLELRALPAEPPREAETELLRDLATAGWDGSQDAARKLFDFRLRAAAIVGHATEPALDLDAELAKRGPVSLRRSPEGDYEDGEAEVELLAAAKAAETWRGKAGTRWIHRDGAWRVLVQGDGATTSCNDWLRDIPDGAEVEVTVRAINSAESRGDGDSGGRT